MVALKHLPHEKEAYGIYKIWASEEGKGHVLFQNRSKHLLRVIRGFGSEAAGESHIFWNHGGDEISISYSCP